MKKVAIVLAAACLLGGTHIILNLAPEAEIVVEAVSPQEIHDLGWTTAPSNGLKVVGIGELVYLSGKEAGGEMVTAYAWSLTGPAGSSATLESTDTEWTTFRPDMAGQFTVDLSVTTASGVADASVVITGAEYIGAAVCMGCHSDKHASWSDTRHASKVTREIDGLGSSRYNENCLQCHTVGYNKDPEAVNGGFDDVQAALGWTFPDSLQAGNWDDMVTNFPTLAQKANIQCENCHGAASQHFGDKTKIDISLDEGLCGRCHEEEPYHRRNIMWKNSGHAQGGTFASRGASATCQPCHNGWGYIARDDIDGADGLGIRSTVQNISCAVCHDPHDATNPHQLRTVADVVLQNGVVIDWGGKGKLCMSCHRDRREGGAEVYVAEPRSTFRGPHGNVQADMLAGTNYISFGEDLPKSPHWMALEDACVSCHMYETPASGELGHDKVGDHTWNMHADDDGVEVDNVAACARCHGQLSSFDDLKARTDHDGDGEIEAAQAEVEGLMEQVATLLPPLGEPTVDIRDPLWNDPGSLLQRQAAWNYLYVEEDQSHGVHNFQLAVSLLKVTLGVLVDGSFDDIAGVVDGLVATGSLLSSQGNALNSQLDAAQQFIDDDNPEAAIGALNKFVAKVKSFSSLGWQRPLFSRRLGPDRRQRTGGLSRKDADLLVGVAEALIAGLEGSLVSAKVSAARLEAAPQSLEVPLSYELAQNYPNPFNPSTQISFAVPEEGHVRITVYDISGKELAVLVDRTMSPGRYQVNWNAEHLASGVYLYRMESRSFVQTHSMLLVK